MDSTHWAVPHLVVAEAIQVSVKIVESIIPYEYRKFLIDLNYLIIIYKRCSYVGVLGIHNMIDNRSLS